MEPFWSHMHSTTRISKMTASPCITATAGDSSELQSEASTGRSPIRRTWFPTPAGGEATGLIEGDTDPSWVAPVFRSLADTKTDSLCISFYGWPHAETFLRGLEVAGFGRQRHRAY